MEKAHTNHDKNKKEDITTSIVEIIKYIVEYCHHLYVNKF